MWWLRLAVVLGVVVPLAFLVLYPWVYLLLPERWQVHADLPQDLQVLFLVEFAVAAALAVARIARGR